jgi:hypothetical protein
MTSSLELSTLGPEAFENLVNFLALKTLGPGATGFGPGADGGRDGYFQGEAPYPSSSERWRGVWYIQSKFHSPHLSKNPQKWLIRQVTKEISAFDSATSDRKWPDNWIIATNIDPSGKPETGSFDAIRRLVRHSKGKNVNVHLWGGRKILDLLLANEEAMRHYRHFLTPGHVLSALYEELLGAHASIQELIRYFVVTQFSEQQFTKLDQAGSSSDDRPGVHDLFIDLPFRTSSGGRGPGILAELSRASAQSHRYSLHKQIPESWRAWSRQLRRARVVLIKGGPGQGKSTIGQYFSQIHRAKLILAEDGPAVIEAIRHCAEAVRASATRSGFWPQASRIPVQIELKEFAHWSSQRDDSQSRSVLDYLAETVSKKVAGEVPARMLRKALARESWIVVLDGLDEVPNDVKDSVSKEVMHFLNDVLLEIDADVLALCTSRPQGYSGQFADLEGPIAQLLHLDAETAIRCAVPLLQFARAEAESRASIATLEAAIKSPSVRELMTTPLQSHIMAIVVRDGGRPPERRWQLFNSFYMVMKKRESLKNPRDSPIARLLREEDRLLKSVHMRLGFILHARAERSAGAQTTLSKDDFRQLVQAVVQELGDQQVDETVAAVMGATTERLVLVNTPENGDQVRFDIRPLQEFFAAEFLYAGVDSAELATRVETIGGDAHWREVMHFLLSALIENQRPTDISVLVQVLRKLNEADDAMGFGLYLRRMARACVLALRLLSEGVLEQDQRDRQQLRPLFAPIGGLLDLRMLKELSALRLTRSRQWLISILLEKITTANPQEYVSALALLGWMLPDRNEHADLAHAKLIDAPVPAQETLFQHWAPQMSLESHSSMFLWKQEESVISPWVIRSAFRILSSADWFTYSHTAIENLLKICTSHVEAVKDIATTEGYTRSTAQAIGKCLGMYAWERASATSKHNPPVNCGLRIAIPYPENWLNGKTPAVLKDIDAATRVQEIDGAFRAMLTCVWFAQERNAAALSQFARIVKAAGARRMQTIPGALLALLPIPGRHSDNPCDIGHLDLDNLSSVDDLVAELKPHLALPYAELGVFVGQKTTTPGQWRRLATTLPKIAVGDALGIDRSWKGETKFVPELILAIESRPAKALRHILTWGDLEQTQPDLLEKLKAAAVKETVDEPGYRIPPGGIVSPFRLTLPTHRDLLRFLAPALIELLRSSSSHDPSMATGAGRTTPLTALLPSYGVSWKQLRDIAESEHIQAGSRAGALALSWLVAPDAEEPADEFDVVYETSLYKSLVNETNESWLTFALIHGVLLQTSESDENARATVTLLLQRTLADHGSTDDLIELMETWREMSAAPVQSKHVLDKWLGYSFMPPPYARHSSS